MSIRILRALQSRRTIIHTAIDDLESFLWVLIWGIVYASKDIDGANTANRGIEDILWAWSGDLAYNVTKLLAAEMAWARDDAVFGGLIQEWLDIFKRANKETWKLMALLPTIPLDNQQGSKWSRECDRLESYCRITYEAVLKSGFHHLEGVREYPNWTEAIAANQAAMDAILAYG
jgi:hypothetical protein